jgi:SAM-dependent methyltransferase
VTWQERYKARFYNRDQGWIDGTTEFHQLCAAHIPRGGRILEVGAGPSNPTSEFLATLGELHGIDPDPAVAQNKSLRTAATLTGNRFPFADGTFDACLSNYVLEHIQDPDSHFSEVHRVLRPNGIYLFRTPNRYHYVAVVARVTPHAFHGLVANPLRGLSGAAHDPYQTAYLLNSGGAVRRAAATHGFGVVELRFVEKEPWYGMASRLLFLPMLAYERIVNSTRWLECLRANIFGVLRRDG